MSRVDEILDFGLVDLMKLVMGNSAHSGLQNPEFDQEVQTRFLKDYEQAIVGQLDHWKLAQELSTNSFVGSVSRNMFRGTAQAFAADPSAVGSSTCHYQWF